MAVPAVNATPVAPPQGAREGSRETQAPPKAQKPAQQDQVDLSQEARARTKADEARRAEEATDFAGTRVAGCSR